MKMRKKETVKLLSAILILLALVLAWFIVLKPLTAEDETDTEIELLDGEAPDKGGRFLLFEHLERSDISSIEVHNEYGEYKLVYSDSGFYVDGFEGISFNAEAFSSLVVAAGYTVTYTRVCEKADDALLKEYGLDDPVAYWTVTSKKGKEYTVYVGDKLLTGGGYYSMVGGRDAVYVLSTTLENSILLPVESFIEPAVCYGMDQNTYFTADDFTILHGDEMFVSVKQCEKSEFRNPEAQSETKLVYPEGYKTNDTYYLNVLNRFIAMSGIETVYLGNDQDVYDSYGLLNPAYKIGFNWPNGKETYTFVIFVSSLQEDGYYYAMSNIYDFQVIIKCERDSFSFLEDDLLSWVDEYPVMYNILYVDSISVDTGRGEYDFNLIHGTDEDGNATLTVTGNDGFTISNSDVYNFRNYYKVLLSIQIMGQLEDGNEAEKIVSDNGNHLLSLTFRMKDGKEVSYSFWKYSSRRALMKVNDSSEFYVMTDLIEKLINDTDKLFAGIEIDSYGKK